MAEEIRLPHWFKEAKGAPCPANGKAAPGSGFLEKTLDNVASAMLRVLDSEESASRPGLLQGINPVVKITALSALIFAAGLTENFMMLFAIIIITGVLARLSRIEFILLAKRVLPALIFTSVLMVPVVFGLGGLDMGGPSLTRHGGVVSAGFFVLRVAAMTGLASLLLLCTRHADVFKGLRAMPLPSFFVTALFMTFRYLFILLKTAEDAALARKARQIGPVAMAEAQRWFAGRVGLLLKRSYNTAEEVTDAMGARGFTGAIKTFRSEGFKGMDYVWLFAAFFVFFLSISI